MDKEPRPELDSKQRAAIKRCWYSDDFQHGIIPLIRRMQDAELSKLTSASDLNDVYRAQGGHNKLKILLDLVRTVATVELTDKERNTDV